MIADDPYRVSNAAAHTTATVQVRGEGSIEVVPDAATVVAGVLTTASDLAQARDDAARIASDLIASARSAGLRDKDIQTSAYTIIPRRAVDKKGNVGAITSYDIRNRVTLTVRELDLLPTVMDAVTGAGGNELAGPLFFVQQPETAEDEARRLAMASARRRAEVLAASAGATLGRVLSIVDGESYGPAPRSMAMARYSIHDSQPPPIEAGVEEVTASVEVIWELV